MLDKAPGGEDRTWDDLESAAVAALADAGGNIETDLIPTLQRAIHHASPSKGEIVIDIHAFVMGLVERGLDAANVAEGESVAVSLVEWLRRRAGMPLDEAVRASRSRETAVLAAYRESRVVIASYSLQRHAATAADSARQTTGRTSGGLRHLTVALFAGGEARDTLQKAGFPDATADLAGLRQKLFLTIAQRAEPGEDVNAWRRQLMEDAAREATTGFAADAPRRLTWANDALDILPDVRAFARLACLREAGTPLSIGLFGGWGSGKSTFMETMEAEVADLAARARASDSRMFVGSVVQIRFNAWHFADADLWASLTAEFFDQLRAGGHGGKGAGVHARLVAEVNALVHRLGREAEARAEALGKAEVALRAAERRAGESGRSSAEIARRAALDVAGRVLAEQRDTVAALSPEAARDAKAFASLARDLNGLGGRIAALWRWLAARPARRALTIAVPILTGFGLWLLPGLAAQAAAALAALGTLAATLMPGVRAVSRIVRATEGLVDALAAADAAADASRLAAAQALADAQEAVAAETEAARAAQAALARYGGSDAARNPPRVLRYLLEDDPDAQALSQDLGLIGRARRLFEAIDAVVAAERHSPDPDPDTPERIILYIDDLDRCTPRQVYEVLQAIHLLLAFRLFVVVVGVDVAWVQRALAQQLQGRETDLLAARYLEKIFQVPYWLQPLDTKGIDGGAYGRLVRGLLAGDIDRNETGKREEGSMDDRGDTVRRTPTEGGPELPTVEATEAPRPPVRSPEDDIDRMRLTQAEVDFLASPEIGALAAREPRAVKRMVNVYRLIRARLEPAERTRFLGRAGAAPEYPMLAIMAAMENGWAADRIEEVARWLMQSEGNLDELCHALASKVAHGKSDDATSIEPDLPKLWKALAAAQEIRGNRPDPIDLHRWRERVRRFSFHPASG